MNLIKATIATAAVITCCLGNDYPAKAADAIGAASAWCQTMDATGNRKKANNAMREFHVATGTTFASSMFYGRSISKATEYQARRMCPEFF
jgi:hypothetical protein